MIGSWSGWSGDLTKAGFSDGAPRTSAVGMYRANDYGLHDMGGNVVEWCSTWYAAAQNDPAFLRVDPNLKDDGGGEQFRVIRGGSWAENGGQQLRSTFHGNYTPTKRRAFIGFRCVLVLSGYQAPN